MDPLDPNHVDAKPRYRLYSPVRRVTFSRRSEVIPDNERRQSRRRVRDADDDANVQRIIFLLTFILPFAGCILYCFSRNARRDSPRYIWAYRALQLGSTLSVVYSFIICSIINHYQIDSFKGDLTGFSYTQGNM